MIWIGLLLLGMLFSSCDDPSETLRVAPLQQPAFVFQNILTWYSEDAQKRIKLEAPTQLAYQSGDLFYPNGLTLTMYDEYGHRSTTLTADSGRHEKENLIFSAFGHVRVINHQKQQTFLSNSLHWNQRRHEIYTFDTLEIITPTERLTGVGMTADEGFDRYKIQQPIGTFTVQEQGTAVAADTLTPVQGPSFDSLMRQYKEQQSQQQRLQAPPKSTFDLLQEELQQKGKVKE
ncbi:MAG: LPS export ABC transporter periplasmic protein LptC [Bernardetiaceae bacterium]